MESRFQTQETSEEERTRRTPITITPIPADSGIVEPELIEELIEQESTTTGSTATQSGISTEVQAPTRRVDPVGYEILHRLKKRARVRWAINWALTILITLSPFVVPNLMALNNITIYLIMGTVLFLYGYAWRDRQRTKRDLERIDDVRMVGPLAETLDAERVIKPVPVITVLKRLLPRMQQSDAKSLTSAQRACLYRALYKHASRSKWLFDKELALEILKAMRQIGDREAVPHVKRVATWSGDSRLRDAANDCLPFLMAQEEEFNRSQTYLRPSSALEMGTDSLLRASIEETPTKPEELLRAAEGTSTSDNTP